MRSHGSLDILFYVSLIASSALAIPYEEYILAPDSRTLSPVSVYQVNGTVSDPDSLLVNSTASGSAVFDDVSAVTFDYGKNIGGVVSLTVGNLSNSDQFIGITFSESSMWISGEASDATADAGLDEVLWFQPAEPGVYTVDPEHVRGAFRYLSLVHNTTGSLEITNVTTHFTAMPHWADDALKNYTGYFHSDDELLNRIWYAGAYTNQLCTIDPHWANALVHLNEITSTTIVNGTVTWWSNTTISDTASVLSDGAKRDRLVWPGDMAIAVPTTVTSTNDLITIRNSLDAVFVHQNNETGQLPYSTGPFSDMYVSFTYHMYSLIGAANYHFYSLDTDWVSERWDQYKFALNWSLSTIDESGMMNVTSPADWLRFGMGGHNIEANAILYYTIARSVELAELLNDTEVIPTWQSAAESIKNAANILLWDSEAGLYRDNETTTLHPQDGNSWAIVSNLTQNASQIDSISAALVSRWTPFGAPAIEAADAISPFISSFELEAHFLAENASAALDLMRLQWGFMLDDPRMTNSTFIEGYSSDGSLHYAPYTNDPRISHAHGWATGPTGSLTFYVAGIKLLSAGGQTWRIEPMLGNLTHVEAGFETPLGAFSSNITVNDPDTGEFGMTFEAPQNTTGSLVVQVPSCIGTLTVDKDGQTFSTVEIDEDSPDLATVDGLEGGLWSAQFVCQACSS